MDEFLYFSVFTEKPPSYDTAAVKQPEDGDKYQRFD
mgnify:CR=1 FL=1